MISFKTILETTDCREIPRHETPERTSWKVPTRAAFPPIVFRARELELRYQLLVECSPDGTFACGLHRAYRRPTGEMVRTVNGENAVSYTAKQNLWVESRFECDGVDPLYHDRILRKLRSLKPDARVRVMLAAKGRPLHSIVDDLLDGSYRPRQKPWPPSEQFVLEKVPGQHTPHELNGVEGVNGDPGATDADMNRNKYARTPTAPVAPMRTPVSISTHVHGATAKRLFATEQGSREGSTRLLDAL